MELASVKILLGKYMEGETTVAEEAQLRGYFSGDEVAPELEAYRPLFAYFSEARDERFTGQVPLKTRRFDYRWLSVAAVGVLMFGLYFGNQYREQREAEYAYNETRKALGMIAQNLDRGTEKVAYIAEFDEAKQKIYKN